MTIRSAGRVGHDAPPRPRSTRATVLVAALALGACGGGGSDDVPSGGESPPSVGPTTGAPNDGDAVTAPGGSVVADVNADGGAGNALPGPSPAGSPDTGDDPFAPATGDIARFGVVAVGDENGLASGDLRAAFSRLSTSVGADAFGLALAPDAAACTVADSDGGPDQDTLSVALYLPRADGVADDPIDAGESVLLSSAAGFWAELKSGPSSRFYTLSSSDAVPAGAVPDDLVANVTGGAFPAFVDARLPSVAPLVDAGHGDGGVTPDTRFTWRAGSEANARIRIEAMSEGSFFVEDGTAVFCLVPDTGEFVFPEATREALGATFAGTSADLSRVAVESVRDGDALLFLVRESFAR